MALPQMLIGVLMGAITWLPPSTEDLPVVVLRPAPGRPEVPGLLTEAPPGQPATASPKMAIALPQALIGAVIGALTWLPPPTLCSPLVCPPPPADDEPGPPEVLTEEPPLQ